MARDSVSQTLLVATILCVVCSVLVAGAAVGLRERQRENKRLDQKKNVLIAAGLYDESENTPADVDEIFKSSINRKIIELKTGDPVSSEVVDPETYDQRKATKDPELSVTIEPPGALGGIKRREKYSFVYEVMNEQGELEQVVLPVYGKGLWSTLYAFIAIDADGSTVRGITFYEHGETPGLGGEVENSVWQSIWEGKELYGEEGEVQLQIIKGSVSEGTDDAEHKIDGLSGATITSNGVTEMIQYWMGPDAFGSYLDKLRTNSGGNSRG